MGMTLPGSSSDAAAARESARQTNGEFGTQHRAEVGGLSLAEFDVNEHEQGSALVDTAYRAARRASRSTGSADRGYAVDDVAQDALVAVLERRARGENVDNVHAYVSTAAANAATKAGRSVRSEDFKAYRILQDRLASFANENGRPATSLETEQMSKDIRETWYDPRHKPSPEFVTNVRGREIANEETVQTSEQNILHAGTTDNYVAPGSHLDQALEAVEGENRDLRAARKHLWNAFAEMSGAPLVDAPHAGHRTVTAARRVIKPETDVVAMVEAWNDETLDTESEEALFAPWATDDVRDRVGIANLLASRPQYAYDMWDSALKSAAKPR